MLGVLFIVLAVCNFWNTLMTVVEKFQKSKGGSGKGDAAAAAGAPRGGMTRVTSRPTFDPTPSTDTKKSL